MISDFEAIKFIMVIYAQRVILIPSITKILFRLDQWLIRPHELRQFLGYFSKFLNEIFPVALANLYDFIVVYIFVHLGFVFKLSILVISVHFLFLHIFSSVYIVNTLVQEMASVEN